MDILTKEEREALRNEHIQDVKEQTRIFRQNGSPGKRI